MNADIQLTFNYETYSLTGFYRSELQQKTKLKNEK